jgi:hypothetical protein
MSSSRPGPLLRLIFHAPVRLYERNLGWLLGQRFVCLTHVGWRYDGTDTARRRMVRQLPIVALRPRSATS